MVSIVIITMPNSYILVVFTYYVIICELKNLAVFVCKDLWWLLAGADPEILERGAWTSKLVFTCMERSLKEL